MAVVRVQEIPESDGSWNRTWQRTYTLNYRVTCSDRRDGPVVIRRALLPGTVNPWLPRIGTRYSLSATEYDFGALLTDVGYRRETNIVDLDGQGVPTKGCVWIVSCQYGPYDAAQFGTDPTLWPIRISYGADPYQRVVFEDQDGTPILNSADCPYEDPVEADDSRSVITVKRNELVKSTALVPGFDPTLSETFQNTTNLKVWNNFPPRQVKCGEITTGDEQYDSNNQVYFYEVTYRFGINRDTWRRKILDQGLQYLGPDGLPTPINDDGKDVKEAVLLDGSGHVLAADGTPSYSEWDVYKEKDFDALGIDFSKAIGR